MVDYETSGTSETASDVVKRSHSPVHSDGEELPNEKLVNATNFKSKKKHKKKKH
jgi:hypothetical protein